MLGALDPRYEWRDLDGVIVFRPVKAWTDRENPLFRLINSVRFDDATMSEAVGVVRSFLGSPFKEKPSFPDNRRVSVDLPQGTVLDLLNALASAHGEMSWQWEPLSAADRRLFAGLVPERRHTVIFSVFGGGNRGYVVP